MPADRREHRFVTLYVYLGDVSLDDAPVYIMPKTHLLGATPFQHDVRYDAPTGGWTYRDGRGGSVSGQMLPVTGKTGHAGMWHPCLIHGGPPIREGHFRISLRYLVARSLDPAPCALDAINQTVKGPLFLETDTTAGANANPDGMWNLKMTDFIRRSYDWMGKAS
jgi:hypothetical protein